MTDAPPALAQAPRRALALDAVRGLAILWMCLSGILPQNVGTAELPVRLPDWMFHAQVPPGRGYVPAIPGISWVDLVFPMFLFAMGVAFPFALERRLEKGATVWSLVPGIVWRGVQLAFFAIYVKHIVAWGWKGSGPEGELIAVDWVWSLLAFAALFPVFVRLPDEVGKRALVPSGPGWLNVGAAFRALGLVCCVVVLAGITFKDGSGFKLGRNDIIILLLGNVAVSGSLVWLFTRRRPVARLLFLAFLFAFWKASAVGGSWTHTLAQAPHNISLWLTGIFYPITSTVVGWFVEGVERKELVRNLTWLFDLDWHKYLFIVIPGTLVGDLMMAWMRGRRLEWTPLGLDDSRSGEEALAPSDTPWGVVRYHLLWLVLTGWVVVGLSCLFARQLVFGDPETPEAWKVDAVLVFTIGSIGLSALVFGLMARPGNDLERLMGQLLQWGVFWLFLGLCFEPLEGGIHKDPSFVSYYFVTTGLSIFCLVVFMIWIDVLGWGKGLGWLVANGQNPMLAYVAIRNLLPPIMGLTGLDSYLADQKVFLNAPWLAFGWELSKTLGLALVVWGFTRAKIIWRT